MKTIVLRIDLSNRRGLRLRYRILRGECHGTVFWPGLIRLIWAGWQLKARMKLLSM